jgi:hypothetical protein
MNYAVFNYTTIVPTLINSKDKAAPFQQFMFHNNVIDTINPLNWQKSQADRLDYDTIKVAIQLLTTASIAGVERIFSSFGLVHSDLHNRLGISKAGNRVFLYKVLNQNQLED